MTNSRPRVRIALVLPASLAQHLTPLQRSAYVIADNKLALRAGLLRRPSMRASPSGTSPLRTSIISRPGQRFPSVIARGDRGGGQRYLSIHRHSGHPPLGGGHSADAPAPSRARLLAGTNTRRVRRALSAVRSTRTECPESVGTLFLSVGTYRVRQAIETARVSVSSGGHSSSYMYQQRQLSGA